MAFTPGPWTWHIDKPATEEMTAEISIDSPHGQVADIFTENCDDDRQCEDDARLIAAAPDLLAACEAVLPVLELMPAPQLGDWNWPQLAEQMRAATLKATKGGA